MKGLSTEKIVEIYNSFMEFGSIEKVARQCEIPWHTAKRYIVLFNMPAARAKLVDNALKQAGIDRVAQVTENLKLLQYAKAKVAQAIKEGKVGFKVSDLTDIMRTESLFTGGPTDRIETPSAVMDNLDIVGENGSRKYKVKDEDAAYEELEVIEAILKFKRNGSGKPVTRTAVKKPRKTISR